MSIAPHPKPRFQPVDTVKRVATMIRRIGHGLKGAEVVLSTALVFIAGILSLLAVGGMGKHRTTSVLRVGTFQAPLIGYLNA